MPTLITDFTPFIDVGELDFIPQCYVEASSGLFSDPSPSLSDSDIATLKWNTTAPLGEQPQIHEHLRQIQSRVNAIHDALSHLNRLAIHFQYEKEKLEYEQKVHRSVLAPVAAIPPEILSKIFIDVQHLESNFQPVVRCSHQQKPSLMTMISRRWRQIALDTPQLWLAIAFCPHRLPFRSAAKSIERARGYPITCRILEFTKRNSDELFQTMKFLDPYAPLIGQMLVEGVGNTVVPRLLKCLGQYVLEALKVLKISGGEPEAPFFASGTSKIKKTRAPNLREIFVYPPATPTVIEAYISLDAVQVFHGAVKGAELQTIFSKMPRLHTATIFVDRFWSLVNLTTRTHPHSNLTHLQFCCESYGYANPLHSLPLLPSLRHFIFRFSSKYHGQNHHSVADFIPFFDRSGRQLQRLELGGPIPFEAIPILGEYTPQLQYLHVNNHNLDFNAFEIVDMAKNLPWTSLTTLQFSGEFTTNRLQEAQQRFSPEKPPYHLQRVKLLGKNAGGDSEVRQVARELIRAIPGLEVIVQECPLALLDPQAEWSLVDLQ